MKRNVTDEASQQTKFTTEAQEQTNEKYTCLNMSSEKNIELTSVVQSMGHKVEGKNIRRPLCAGPTFRLG